MDNDTVDGDLPMNDEVTYDLVVSSSQRRNLLTDSRGYSYTVKKVRGEKTYWRCAVRNKTIQCGASVIQTGDHFEAGSVEHNHPGKPGNNVVARLITKVKDRAVAITFRSATAITNEAIGETVSDAPLPALPKPINLAR
ncbi:uncharacterized protein LOC110980464 [Acanthaster planci]|uniref:Uncharacterized protein LOC110980464 n=1 Tax=Acanthaster planci TaxID=133434 RepID=A0A8B7YJP8_ACAPL|nr:uncharacterized protein LOC110980464 [Acanthaster planci]